MPCTFAFAGAPPLLHPIIVKPELSGVINDPNGACDDSSWNSVIVGDAGNQPRQLGIKPHATDIPHDLHGSSHFTQMRNK